MRQEYMVSAACRTGLLAPLYLLFKFSVTRPTNELIRRTVDESRGTRNGRIADNNPVDPTLSDNRSNVRELRLAQVWSNLDHQLGCSGEAGSRRDFLTGSVHPIQKICQRGARLEAPRYDVRTCTTQRNVETYRSPGVFGLETLITNTSACGPKVSTPDTKSAIESVGDVLFFPRLTARTEPGRRDAGTLASPGRNGENRARIRESTDAWPSDGNPYRLINASSSGRWKTRGRGLPCYGSCVRITRLLAWNLLLGDSA